MIFMSSRNQWIDAVICDTDISKIRIPILSILDGVIVHSGDFFSRLNSRKMLKFLTKDLQEKKKGNEDLFHRSSFENSDDYSNPKFDNGTKRFCSRL